MGSVGGQACVCVHARVSAHSSVLSEHACASACVSVREPKDLFRAYLECCCQSGRHSQAGVVWHDIGHSSGAQ